jgi:hypothetical protein
MTKLVTVPIQCGNEWHCVDIDTNYGVHVRNHSQEDIDAELTIKDLCPEYEMVECVKFSATISASISILGYSDARASWVASDTTLMSSIVFSEFTLPNAQVLYFATMLRDLVQRCDLPSHIRIKKGMSIRDYSDKVIEYLDKIIASNGEKIPERLVHISVSENNLEPIEVITIGIGYIRLILYLNGGIDWRLDHLSKGDIGVYFNVKSGVFGLYRDIITGHGVDNVATWSDKIIIDILNKEAKRLGCGI